MYARLKFFKGWLFAATVTYIIIISEVHDQTFCQVLMLQLIFPYHYSEIAKNQHP